MDPRTRHPPPNGDPHIERLARWIRIAAIVAIAIALHLALLR